MKRKPYGKHRYLTEEQLTAFMKAARKVGAEEWLMMALTYYYGLRVSELADLRWEQVDLKARRIVVLRSKGGRDESYIILPELLRSLQRQRQRHPDSLWLFPARQSGTSGSVTEQTCKNVFKRVAAAAGVDGKSIHSLRHTCAMMRALNGATALELAGWLGHRDIGSVDHYITAFRHARHEAALAPAMARFLR